MDAKQLSGARVVVMGLGRFGGGIGVTRWLVESGADVLVTDKSGAEELKESVGQLAGLPLRFRLGAHDEKDLDDCDLLVVSPAVDKARSEFVAAAARRGTPITSEMNLFAERCPARQVIGITGSAGKSTTTAMIGAVLSAASAAGPIARVWVGGNIGQSLLGSLAEMSADDVVVLELSSFQLEDLGRIQWSPSLSIITNIQPNHLDRHGTLDVYASEKLNIVRFQGPDGLVLVHAGDEEVGARVRQAGAGARLRWIEPLRCDLASDAGLIASLRVPGRHNRVNASAAVAVARAMGLPDAVSAQGLSSFEGLPHRLQFVAECGGVRYYNDSKATTPEASLIALSAFEQPVIMLVGGRDKKIPFDGLTRELARRAKAVICFGEQGPVLFEQVQRYSPTGGGPVARLAKGFDEVVLAAQSAASAGDVVVLSPACVSYDMFTNYEQRGEEFCRIVRAMGE